MYVYITHYITNKACTQQLPVVCIYRNWNGNRKYYCPEL